MPALSQKRKRLEQSSLFKFRFCDPKAWLSELLRVRDEINLSVKELLILQ